MTGQLFALASELLHGRAKLIGEHGLNDLELFGL
jgi:hypothetical protein